MSKQEQQTHRSVAEMSRDELVEALNRSRCRAKNLKAQLRILKMRNKELASDLLKAGAYESKDTTRVINPGERQHRAPSTFRRKVKRA